MIRSRGHCNTMGTASTMAVVAEALGMVVPGVAGTPAADSRLLEAAHGTGRLAVEMVAAERRPSTFLARGSFANAIVALAAVGGSTNAVVHLLAIAGRLGIDLTLDDFDRTGSGVPVLVDLLPAGRFLMEDLHRAGGLLAGLPEVSNMPLPRKLLEQGVRDMVRVCDGRMSGTAYGTVVLHVAPEAAAGGPLALVRTGDVVSLDVAARRIDVEVPDGELAARRPDEATTA